MPDAPKEATALFSGAEKLSESEFHSRIVDSLMGKGPTPINPATTTHLKYDHTKHSKIHITLGT
jgi:hypothetical protein